ncbi:prepilin-type N-terminal cleavage/methylation domain-containing protein [Bacillus shivajii]|uniref:competence type IV pilus major pilin ComGC n=1 Tax=Bacillus shivajii TaxID=1983719 RepID=UPI001CFC0E67|nr:competence type IV pilus major pilin ComGC [Bacillus shivajii]UCZ54573.1 prepilin-type N-terminal cleavage/methylation domain-containing protein [Bacillus shivajii]
MKKQFIQTTKWKSEYGFTLIEMMIVLVIISILLLIAVPNMTKNKGIANDAGCDATIELLQTQVVAYQIENDQEIPDSIDELEEYVDREKLTCPDGTKLTIDTDGKVTVDNEKSE